jgi:hypothetical protein
MLTIIVFTILLGWSQAAEKYTQPVISATDPFYLGCVTWTGKEWTKPTARSARTPIWRSSKGLIAYAEVVVTLGGDACENTSAIYVASGNGREFKAVWSKRPSEVAGNGIRLIGWSPDGNKLLAQVNSWRYNSDMGFDYAALIYDASTGSAHEVSALDDAFRRRFGANCDFDLSVKGWMTSNRIVVKVLKPQESEGDELVSCVDRPRIFVYDLQKETVEPNRHSTPLRLGKKEHRSAGYALVKGNFISELRPSASALLPEQQSPEHASRWGNLPETR